MRARACRRAAGVTTQPCGYKENGPSSDKVQGVKRLLPFVDRRAVVVASRKAVLQVYPMFEHEHQRHGYDDNDDGNADHQQIGSLPIVFVIGGLRHATLASSTPAFPG